MDMACIAKLKGWFEAGSQFRGALAVAKARLRHDAHHPPPPLRPADQPAKSRIEPRREGRSRYVIASAAKQSIKKGTE